MDAKTPSHARQSRNTILSRLLIPVMLIMLLQSCLHIALLWQGGVISHADQNAYDVLRERVNGRARYLENDMVHKWSAIGETEAAILDTLSSALAGTQYDITDIAHNAALNNQLVERMVPYLIYMLRKNMVTGAFVMLDGPGLLHDQAGLSRAGFYVRDPDPTSYSDDNLDLLVERGMPVVSKRLGLTFNTCWESTFTLSPEEDNRFYFEPLRAAQAGASRSSGQYGYWSGGIKLDANDIPSLTYSIPLICAGGAVVGVMGVDLSESYLRSLLTYDELLPSKAGAYCLAVTENNGQTYRRIMSNGPMYALTMGGADTFTVGREISESIYHMEDSAPGYGNVLGCISPLTLYNQNTPFCAQQWALIGVAGQSDLLHFSDQLTRMAWAVSAFSLALGVLCVYLASRMMTRPITELVCSLRKSDPNQPISLPKLGIREIDQLTNSIETLSASVADSASKISKILSLTKDTIGVFESSGTGDYVFCSSNLFALLDWPDPPTSNDGVYLRNALFDARMAVLEAHLFDEQEGIYLVTNASGASRYVQLTKLMEQEKLLGAITDVTSTILTKQKIEYERDYDLLTGLNNRRAFEQKLRLLFASSAALGHCALIMWDLDDLKYINDTYGHDLGDNYIIALSECLSTFSRSDSCVVARRSGDEFYAFVHGYPDHQAIEEAVENIWQHILTQPFFLPGGIDYRIHVSAGVSWYPEDATTWQELLRYADYAMYNVKHTGKGNLRAFDKAAYQSDQSLLYGTESLNELIEKAHVRYAFQPIVSVNTQTVYGYELLMRPESTQFPSPSDVLRIAQAQTKLYQIERITWVTALAAFVERVRAGAIAPDQYAFINSIASQNLTQADLTLIERTYAPYLKRVVVEIIESEPGTDQNVRDKAEVIKHWGAQTAIDDYGVGYNSEASLIFLSPDLVKLDMSIVRDIDKNQNLQNLVRSIMGYVRTRGVRVIAEGVETEGEMRELVRQGVDFLQGYYLGRPNFDILPIVPEALSALRDAVQARKHAET
ncbi:MAG: EAL domain-containing protein [Clostridia bacterium]